VLQEESFAEGIRLEVDPEALVAIVTFDRPPVNALHPEGMRQLRAVLDSLGDRTDVNCCILTAAGKVFSAGIDLRAGAGPDPTPMERLRQDGWTKTVDSIANCGVPVIAAVSGTAVGAGIGLAWAADIIVASTNAKFGLNELNIGALGGGVALWRMVGIYKARSMFFTGDYVDAEEFYRLGAIEKVVAPDELLPAALEIAARITPKSGLVLRLGKMSFNRMEKALMNWDVGYMLEHSFAAERAIEDGREAMASWMEKRPPVWKWR
jgi:enoyl-CoA hydratase/carnithine racemase